MRSVHTFYLEEEEFGLLAAAVEATAEVTPVWWWVALQVS